jgi:uncharacterized protein YlxW (UPF0749 family)
MKFENFFNFIKEASPILSLVSGIFVVIGYIFFYSINMQFEIKNLNEGLNDEHNIMKSYVDSKDSEINIRLDNLNEDIQKTNESVQVLNNRIDSTLTEILQLNKETNDRLDKIIITISSKDFHA